MDIEQIEAEANATAAKHVANMLQRPDQLEKVEQYMRRESRKKCSVEAMLKQAVQTQLDGAKTGLSQQRATLEDIKEIKLNLQATQKTLSDISELSTLLADVKEQSSKHRQYATAMEHLKHIITIPESIPKTREHIMEGELLLAHQSLSDLENSRDDLLYEIYKRPNRNPSEENALKRYFQEVEKLSEELSKQLWLVLGRILNSVRKEPQVIVTAMRIIEREEVADSIAESRRSTGYSPIGRPKRWKKKAFEVLRSSVLERIEGNQFEDRSENKMWLVRHLEVTRQLVIEDLKVVKTACVPCFPEKYNIVAEFVKMYHESLAKHLEDIIASGLEGNEYVTLLDWVSNYGSAGMLGHPELGIDVQKVGSLLDNKVIESLEDQYLNNLKENYKDWIKNSLASDVKDWHRDVEPEQNATGIFHTSLPVIICNMMDQNFQVAETVSQNLLNKVIILSMKEILSFIPAYNDAIKEYKREYFDDRSSVKFFTFYIIAIANNCLEFKNLVEKLKLSFIKSSSFTTKAGGEKVFQSTLAKFEELRRSVLKILWEELFVDLNSHLNDLCTKKWIHTGSEILDTISCTLEDYCQDYKHLPQKNFDELIDEVQKKIAVNYIQSLLQRKITCKGYDERKGVAEKICEEGKTLQQLFQRLSLFHVKKNSPFEALPCLAEVLKLKDISMLSLEVSGVLRKYPDASFEQLVSLILLRGDMGKSDAKQLVTDIMTEVGHQTTEKTVFSDVYVSL